MLVVFPAFELGISEWYWLLDALRPFKLAEDLAQEVLTPVDKYKLINWKPL